MIFYVDIVFYTIGFSMRKKKVKTKKTKNNKKKSHERDAYDREIWRPCNPWTLP